MIRVTTIEDKVNLEGVGTFPAKALRWEDAGGGLVSVYDEWAKIYLVSRARVDQLVDESDAPLIGGGQTLAEAVEQKVTQQVVSVGRAYFWAEENGNLNNNSYQYSFGNGLSNTNNHLVLPCAGWITQVSLNVTTAPKSTCVVEAIVNGHSAGAVTLSAGRTYDVDNVTPFRVERQDRLKFRTVTGGSAQRGTVMVEIELD